MTNSSADILGILDNQTLVPVHDPLWGHIYLPEEFFSILKSASFMKLCSIRQLGPTYLVYPGASHTRYNHSIGVYGVARQFIRAILLRCGDTSFTAEGIMHFLCAALCHDLGHFPYTHSMKELPLRDHEELTGDILAGELAPVLKKAGLDPEWVAAIVDQHRPELNQETKMYRGLLSGVLDPDKLDYLQRDGYYCGLPFGTQDLDYILRSLHFDPDRGLGIDPGGIRSIEHLLFSKYLLYKSVYWHPQVRMATGMIKKALYQALEEGLVKDTQLYNLTDEGFHRTFLNFLKGAPGLVQKVAAGQLFEVISSFPSSGFPALDHNLLDLEKRTLLETRIAHYLSGVTGTSIHNHQVLIDVPERISFEVQILVWDRGEAKPYLDADTVFNQDVVENFTRSLRHIRIGLDPEITPLIKNKEHSNRDILEIMKAPS